jgi:hypothetical protein
MEVDIIRIIKEFEKEFLNENLELYKEDRLEYLKQREEFVGKKVEEMKKDEDEE